MVFTITGNSYNFNVFVENESEAVKKIIISVSRIYAVKFRWRGTQKTKFKVFRFDETKNRQIQVYKTPKKGIFIPLVFAIHRKPPKPYYNEPPPVFLKSDYYKYAMDESIKYIKKQLKEAIRMNKDHMKILEKYYLVAYSLDRVTRSVNVLPCKNFFYVLDR